jgi:hypothetical protein
MAPLDDTAWGAASEVVPILLPNGPGIARDRHSSPTPASRHTRNEAPGVARLGAGATPTMTLWVRPKQYLALCIEAALSRYEGRVMKAGIVE